MPARAVPLGAVRQGHDIASAITPHRDPGRSRRRPPLAKSPPLLRFRLGPGPARVLRWFRGVTVRITVVECPGARTIHVEGRLSNREVGELAGVLGGDLAAVRLELRHLLSFDGTALAYLRGLHAAGVEMRGAMPHLAWQITEEEP